MTHIVLVNQIEGIALEKLWNSPESIRKAEIKNSQLFLFCKENVSIFAGMIQYSDTPVKGIKFSEGNIQITI
jgi:hypothetical protein